MTAQTDKLESPPAVGIDFGGTTVKVGVVQGPDLLERLEAIPTAEFSDAEALIQFLADQIQRLCQRHPCIGAIGVGVPGLVDFDQGFVHELTNVQGWNHVPLRTLLSQHSGLPVVVDNDANCMTYAEWRHGSGQGFDNVIALTLGTGVGGGLILNGRLYRGSQFAAGEVGQMSIDYRGRPGNYGNLGALEHYVGNQQIASHAVIHYAQINRAMRLEECTPKHIAERAQGGDGIARRIWGDVGEWLGTGLANVVWLLNPDVIIIGGGIAQAGDLLFKPLSAKLGSMLSTVQWEHLQLRSAHFGNDAGIIGSAAMAVDYLTERHAHAAAGTAEAG